MKTQQHKTKFYGWINAALLFFIYGTVMGVVFYGFSVIFPVMLKTQQWSRGDASMAHTIRGLLVGFMAPVVALSVNRIGSRLTMIIGLAVMSVAMALLGFAASELWRWIAIWGFIMPIAFAFSGIIPVQTTLMFWFNLKRTTALGIVLSGAAAVGFIVTPLLSWLMQAYGSWETGWQFAGVICVIAMICANWVRGKPSELGQHIDGIMPEEAGAKVDNSSKKSAKTYRTPVPWTLKEALRTRVLYLTMLVMISQLWALYIVTVHGVLHLTDIGFTNMQASTFMSIFILSSGVARFPMGVIGDLVEPQWILAAAMGMMCMALIGIWQVSSSFTSLLMFGAFFGFAFGTTVIMFPAIIGNYFGPPSFAGINGFIQPFMIGFGAPLPVVAGYIADKFGSYDMAFMGVIVMVAFGTVCTVFISPPTKKQAESAAFV